MPVIKSFDPNDVIVTINGVNITGFADGTFIEVDRDEQGRDYTECNFADLQPGDIVIAFKYLSDKGFTDLNGSVEITDVGPPYVYGQAYDRSGNKVGGPNAQGATGQRDVICRVIQRSTTPKQVAPASKWNGKCPACGRGTYTGMHEVEHEGGSCAR